MTMMPMTPSAMTANTHIRTVCGTRFRPPSGLGVCVGVGNRSSVILLVVGVELELGVLDTSEPVVGVVLVPVPPFVAVGVPLVGVEVVPDVPLELEVCSCLSNFGPRETASA